jgi:hypothetical protein
MSLHQTGKETESTLGAKLGEAALTAFVRLCPEAAKASNSQLEYALQAMHAQSQPTVEELMDDLREAPWIAEWAWLNAVMSLVAEGTRAFREYSPLGN